VGKEEFINFIQRERSFRIIPSTDLDSLLASAIILKNLALHGYDVKVNFDPKYIIDEPGEPQLLINLKPVQSSKQFSLEPMRDTSISGLVVTVLDEMFGVDKWDKILALISGIYRNLDTGQDGFKGLEQSISNYLLVSKEMGKEVGIKLWGHKRIGLAKSFARTLIPFLPGFTGLRDRVEDFLKKATKSADVNRLQPIDISTDEGRSTIVELTNLIKKSINIPQDYLKNYLMRLIGFNYTILTEVGQIELLEVMGSILVFTSLKRENVFKTLGYAQQALFTQVLSIYEEVIDEVAALLGSAIPEQLLNGKPVDVEGFIERPDLIVDVANEMPMPNSKTPVSIIYNGGTYTVLRELLRIGVEPSKAYESCDEVQICAVTGNV